jgi:hypothetical protein
MITAQFFRHTVPFTQALVSSLTYAAREARLCTCTCAQRECGCHICVCRRKPASAPAGWWGTPQEPSLLASLGEFTESMGSAMAALGMFAQVRSATPVSMIIISRQQGGPHVHMVGV